MSRTRGRGGKAVALARAATAAVALGLGGLASPAATASDGAIRVGDFVLPGLFVRNADDLWKPGTPTESGRSLQSRDGVTLVVVEGVDPPLPVDRRLDYGCVSLRLRVGSDGRVTSSRLLDAMPGDGNFALLGKALSTWRFNPSTLLGRTVWLPLVSSPRYGLLDGPPAGRCRFSRTIYTLTLPANVSLDRQALLDAPDFYARVEPQAAPDVGGYEYPRDLLHRGEQGCVTLSFRVDTQGRPASFELLKAWPDEPDIAKAFTDAAVGGLRAMPALRVQGAASDERAQAVVRFAAEKPQRELPSAACAPNLRLMPHVLPW